MGVIKGQFFRVKVEGKVLAMSKSCTVHKAADLEESSTKDSTGMAKEQDVVATSWDGGANGLVSADTDAQAQQGFDLLDLVGQKVEITFLETQGTKNREAKSGGITRTGYAIVNDCQLEFPDRADSTYSIQFTGTGELTKTPQPEQ